MKTLWKVVRRPMIRWWLRNGSWWLMGIALVSITQSMVSLYLATSLQHIPVAVLYLLLAAVNIAPIAVFVVSASICDGYVFRFYEQQAAPMPGEILWGRYLLALFQGIPIAITVIVVSIITGFYWNANLIIPVSDIPGGELTLIIGAITRPFTEFAQTAVIGIWLVLFIVLAAKKSWLKYGVFVAYLMSTILGYAMAAFQNTIWNSADNSLIYPYSEYKLLSLVALPLWLLFADSVKMGEFKLANTLQVILGVSIAGNMGFIALYELFGGACLYGLSYATEIINSAFYFNPGFVTPITSALSSRFSVEETLLGYLPYFLKPILVWVKPCLLLGLIYFFVFNPNNKIRAKN